jgi:hypothetical protein
MRWRMDLARRYQQALGKHGFDYVMDCEVLGVGRRAHNSPLYHVKSLPNEWYGWCIDTRYLIDSWLVTLRAWDRLEKLMRWEYKKKYGRMPSEEELKRVKSELYASEIIRRNMERAGGHGRKYMERGGGESRWMRSLLRSSGG